MGKSKNNKGFTLTELIIAVAVLGIVISLRLWQTLYNQQE